MSQHVDVLGSDIVKSVSQAAMAYLSDPAAQTCLTALTSGLMPARLDPAHKPLVTRDLVDYWCLCGTPEQLQERARTMLDAGVDMIGGMLSNRFTAERDVADIGSSILAHA